jgi:hypothetical protein
MASSSNGPCGALIGFVIGLGLVYGGAQTYLLVQKIKNTPTSKVEGAAVGMTELSGTARCHDPDPSPLSKVNSAYWKVVGAYFHSAGKNSHWVQIFTRESGRRFYLKDDTGEMLVDSTGGTLDIPVDKTCEGYISGRGEFGMAHTQLGPEAMDFINGLDPVAKGTFMAHQYENVRIMESYIADGDPLFVLGSAEPQEGKSSSVGYENLILKKGIADKTLYISDTGERKVLDKLSGGMYWMIFGGLALAAVCLLFLLISIGVK